LLSKNRWPTEGDSADGIGDIPEVVLHAALQIDSAVLSQGKVQGDFKVTQVLLAYEECGSLATATNHSFAVLASTTDDNYKYMKEHLWGKRLPIPNTAEYKLNEQRDDGSHTAKTSSMMERLDELCSVGEEFMADLGNGAAKVRMRVRLVITRWAVDGKAMVEFLGKGAGAFARTADHPSSPASRNVMGRILSYGEHLPSFMGFYAPPCLKQEHYRDICTGYCEVKGKATKRMKAFGGFSFIARRSILLTCSYTTSLCCTCRGKISTARRLEG
jgi:hypothetical protein